MLPNPAVKMLMAFSASCLWPQCLFDLLWRENEMQEQGNGLKTKATFTFQIFLLNSISFLSNHFTFMVLILKWSISIQHTVHKHILINVIWVTHMLHAQKQQINKQVEQLRSLGLINCSITLGGEEHAKGILGHIFLIWFFKQKRVMWNAGLAIISKRTTHSPVDEIPHRFSSVTENNVFT